MSILKNCTVSTVLLGGTLALLLSACGGAQSAAQACITLQLEGAKLFDQMNSVVQTTSADPSRALKTFQTAADQYKAGTRSISNSKVRETNDLIVQDLEKIIDVIKDVEAAGKSGQSTDELHNMVIERMQPAIDKFENDWNTKGPESCSRR